MEVDLDLLTSIASGGIGTWEKSSSAPAFYRKHEDCRGERGCDSVSVEGWTAWWLVMGGVGKVQIPSLQQPPYLTDATAPHRPPRVLARPAAHAA